MNAVTADSFAGTPQLIRLALKRDRTMLPAWIAVFVVMAAASAFSVAGLYPTIESRVRAAESINSTGSLVALYGQVYDPTSLGAIALIKLTGLGAALVALLATNVVIRHTRGEEESGRLELVGATVVGRYAPLTAAILVGVSANLVLGAATAVSLVAAGLDMSGSAAFGLMWAVTGIAFAGVAAVAAQLTTAARSALGIVGASLVVAYLLRALGDTADAREWMSWLSPIGWSQQIRPFAGDRWIVSGGLLVGGVATTLGAFALTARRDLGAGLLPDRPGPSRASRWLRGAEGLAWRLHRGVLAGWLAGFAVLGATLGAIASDVEGLLDNPGVRDMIETLGGEQVLSDAFLAAEMSFVGVFASAYAIAAVHRMRGEESALRAELLLSRPLSRARWAWSHLLVAVLGATLLLVVAGGGAGVAHAIATSDTAQVWRVLSGGLVQVPAVALFAGLALAGVGLLPRGTAAGWGALVLALLIGEFGPIFELPRWIIDLSPFGHVPALPGGDVRAVPLVVLTALAAALVAIGLGTLRRRDIVG